MVRRMRSRSRARRPIKSRRRSFKKRVSFRRKSFRRSSRGRSRGRAVNIARAHNKITREFLWGRIATNQDGTHQNVILSQPNGTGGAVVTTLPLKSGTVATFGEGFAFSFLINDLPPAELALIQLFNWYKLDSVTLKFKPRWMNTGQDVTLATGTTTNTTLGGGGGAPRLYMHTQRDYYRLTNDTVTQDYIMSYADHTIYDLTKQRLYHLKPSSTQTGVLIEGGGGGGSIAPERPIFNKWYSTRPGIASDTNEITYQGLQSWVEWENPPLPTVVPSTNTDGVVIDIYATYTVSTKQLEV